MTNLAPAQPAHAANRVVAWSIGLLSAACGTVHGAAGDGDLTFNSSGFTTVAIHATGDTRAQRVRTEPDGKVLLAGTCSAPGVEMPTVFCLTRVLPSGALDTTFGVGSSPGAGRVITPIGNANGEGDSLTGLTLQDDGKIVVAGSCERLVGAGPNTERLFCIARYTSNGVLDSGFNGSGFVITPSHSTQKYARGSSLVVQPDGKLLVGGWCISATGNVWSLCLVRYLPNGVLDTAGFNASAPIAADRGKVVFSVGASNNNMFPALAVQTDGRIIAGGTCVGPVQQSPTYCVARFHSDGSVDTTWSGATDPNEANITGLVRTLIGYDGRLSSMLIQPDGQIVVVGNCRVSATQLVMFCAARLRADGSLDTSFGSNGYAIVPMNSPRYTVVGQSYGGPYRVAQQPDGKLLLAGTCGGTTATMPPLQGSQACMLRMHADGSLDATYFQELQFSPRSGRTFDAPGIPNSIDDVDLQSDGRIVIAGTWFGGTTPHAEAYVARLVGGPNNYANCSADIDGDGRVTTSTDSALLARAALRFTGSALIQGLTFASQATRKTSLSVRDFLFNQCGMRVSP